MKWLSLERVWKSAGRKEQLKVRFNDWTHQVKYFIIHGESNDGKRFIGTLDSGEKIAFSKKSRGWDVYYPGAELDAKAV